MATKQTFKSVLKRSNNKIQEDRAKRLANQAHMDYDELLNSKKKEIFNYENELEDMMDISASNVTTTANRIQGVSFNSADFVKKRCDLLVKLELAKAEFKVIEADSEFYTV